MRSLYIFLAIISTLLLIQGQKVIIDAYTPKSLQDILKKPEAKVSIANYGFVPYGKSLLGTVVFANPRNACSPLQPIHGELGHESARIILVERGGCTFVTKTHYSQMIGAQLVLIADNTDEDEDFVILVDDGMGQEISIPTLMISKFLGNWITAYQSDQNAEPIVLSVKFSLVLCKKLVPRHSKVRILNFVFQPPPVHTVKYELWMSSLDGSSYNFIKVMKDQHFLLGDRVNFSPHYVLWFCSICRNSNYTSRSENCVSGGRYCSPDPDQSGPLTGKNVVMEDLRQICIYKTDPLKWWDYMIEFEDCYNKTRSQVLANLETCSKEKQANVKLNQTQISECVSKSFNGIDIDIEENELLANERLLFYKEGVQLWPSIKINNMSFRGNMNNAEGTMEAICNEFDDPPEICSKYVEVSHVRSINYNEDSKMSAVSIILIVLLSVSVFMAIVLYLYRRKIRREMQLNIQSEVSSAITKYYSLNEGKKVNI